MRKTVDIYEPGEITKVLKELQAAKTIIALNEKSKEHAVRRIDTAIRILRGDKNNEGS